MKLYTNALLIQAVWYFFSLNNVIDLSFVDEKLVLKEFYSHRASV